MADQESNPEPQEQNDSIQLDQAIGGQQPQHENVSSNENPPTEQTIKDTGTKPKIRKESTEHVSEHEAKVPDTLPETQNTHGNPRKITHNVVEGPLLQQPHNMFGQGLPPNLHMTYAQVAASNVNPQIQPQQQQFNYIPTQQQQSIPQQTQTKNVRKETIEELQERAKHLRELGDKYRKLNQEIAKSNQIEKYKQNKSHNESISSDTSYQNEELEHERTHSTKQKHKKPILLQKSKLGVTLKPDHNSKTRVRKFKCQQSRHIQKIFKNTRKLHSWHTRNT